MATLSRLNENAWTCTLLHLERGIQCDSATNSMNVWELWGQATLKVVIYIDLLHSCRHGILQAIESLQTPFEFFWPPLLTIEYRFIYSKESAKGCIGWLTRHWWLWWQKVFLSKDLTSALALAARNRTQTKIHLSIEEWSRRPNLSSSV